VQDDLRLLVSISKRLRGSPDEQVAAGAQMREVLARFREEQRASQLETLAAVRADVARLERNATAAIELFDDASGWAKELEKIVKQYGNSPQAASEASARHDQIRAAADTNAAILLLFRSQPGRVWRPKEVTEALTAAGRHATKSMVESALKRLADNGVLRRPGEKRGGYCLAEAAEEVVAAS